MKIRTIDISGMGGGYENSCQLMLKAALEFDGSKDITRKDFSDFGFASTDKAKEMQGAMLDVVNNDCTGAMMGTVLAHFFFIQENGREKWLAEIDRENPGRIYEWDGTEKSIPPAEGLTLNETQHISPRTGKMP